MVTALRGMRCAEQARMPTTVTATITRFDAAYSEKLVSHEETWTLGDPMGGRGGLPVAVMPDGTKVDFMHSGRVNTWPALRKRLGFCGVTGEGIQLAVRAPA